MCIAYYSSLRLQYMIYECGYRYTAYLMLIIVLQSCIDLVVDLYQCLLVRS